eukprot:6862396-Prymnesium_polylepis.1
MLPTQKANTAEAHTCLLWQQWWRSFWRCHARARGSSGRAALCDDGAAPSTGAAHLAPAEN